MAGRLLSPSLRCAQNIALLSILPKICIQASEEVQFTDLSISSKSDVLLVHVLAYLTAIDINPEHVIAVAVEGVAEGSSLLHVYVAINKARPNDGHVVLEGIVSSFRRLFSIMTNSRSGTIVLRNRLLCEAVDLCRGRIFHFLGLQYIPPANKKRRFFLGGHLQKFVGALQRRATPAGKPDPDLLEFLARSAKLITTLDPLRPAIFTADATHPDSASLVHVVYSVYLYSKALGDGLGRVVDRLTEYDISTVNFLKRRIHGLAQFVQCAHFLCRLALDEKPPWLGNVEVEPVQLTAADLISLRPAPASQTPSPPDLDVCLAQWDWTADKLNRALREHTYRASSPRPLFSTICNQLYGLTHNKPKIHAEIQIAYHLDGQNRDRRDAPPLTICASKSPCYLCYTFLTAHGGYTVPPTHGQLYPGWRLPHCDDVSGGQSGGGTERKHNIPTASFAVALDQLNTALEAEIRSRLLFLARPHAKKIKEGSSNESPLFKMPPSESSLAVTSALSMASVVLEAEEKKDEPEGVVASHVLGTTETTPLTSVSPPAGSQDKVDSDSDSDVTVQQHAVEHSPEVDDDTNYDVVFHSADSWPAVGRRYATDELELFVTFGSEDGGVRDAAVPRSSVRVRKLSVDEAASCVVHAVDVSGLAFSAEVPAVPVDADGHLHLRVGSGIYKVLVSMA